MISVLYLSLLPLLLIFSGEQSCHESRSVREENEKHYGNSIISTVHNIMGRRVDMLISLQNQNISSCEWKASNATPTMAKKQESKNVRTKCCILESLLRLPYDGDNDEEGFDVQNMCITYMDWIVMYINVIPMRI